MNRDSPLPSVDGQAERGVISPHSGSGKIPQALSSPEPALRNLKTDLGELAELEAPKLKKKYYFFPGEKLEDDMKKAMGEE